MPVEFIKKYGPNRSVQEYIELAGYELHCYQKVIENAKAMYNHLAITSTYSHPTNRMKAAIVLFLAAKNEGQLIYSSTWSEKGIAAYPPLIEHAKKVKPLLEDKWPGLKNVRIGKD